MKKTITITIAGVLFHIEEDAYERLSKYMQSVSSYFASEPESSEIVADIESRIAEQFTEKSSGHDKIIHLRDVEDLIQSMGDVEDFKNENISSGAEHKEETEQKEKIPRKLFRNPDDVIIAGVASGIAAYFNVDPTIVRLIFVLLVLVGASGLPIYIILWLILPLAKTSTDKLQMRGESVTLESVGQVFKEKVEEVRKNRSTGRRLINFPFLALRRIFEVLFPLIRKIVGLLLVVVSAAILFGLTLTLAMTIFNVNSPYVDFPLMQVGHPALVLIGLFAAFFTIFIPVAFLSVLGSRILGKKKKSAGVSGAVFVGIWCLSVITLAVVGTKLVPEYQNMLETSPLYAETTREFTLSDFSAIESSNGSRVTISEGPEFKVTALGRSEDLDRLSVEVSEGALRIGRKNDLRICIFCRRTMPEVSVQMPKIDSIKGSNASSIQTEKLSGENLSVTLSNGSKLSMTADLKNLSLKLSNASFAELVGTSTRATFSLANGSRIKAGNLSSRDVSVDAKNASRADVRASETLSVEAENGSYVSYFGDPEVTQNLHNASTLRKNNPATTSPENEW